MKRPTLHLYGIRNCDTMKRARTWLDDHHLAYEFHDYKSAGIERARLARWVQQLGWEALLNRNGTTFRRLPEARRGPLDADRAIELMLEQPSTIRRPVLECGPQLLAGFRADLYQQALL